MGNIKYKEGDLVGVNKDILLIKRIAPTNSGKGYLCEFKCPYCKAHFTADLYKVNRVYYSCGCYQKNNVQFKKNDITGKKYGKLVVLSDSGKRVVKNKRTKETSDVIWICQCECGNITEVSTSHLVTGHTTSCGLCCISKGEDKIKAILDELNIDYEQQKRFLDCKDIAPLLFDFYIPSYNCCIEYDGEQHFHIPKNKTSTLFTQDKVDKIQMHDKIKNEYCKTHKINLIRILYTDFDILSTQYLIERLTALQQK